MQAVNLKTPAVMCHKGTSSIEVAVASMPGVIGVTVSVTGGSTSVMFDEARTSNETIVAAIRGAGFDVEIVGPGRLSELGWVPISERLMARTRGRA